MAVHISVVRALALPVVALNLADAVFTIGWVKTGMAVEANPLMANLLSLNPAVFIVTKLGLVVLGLALLDRNRESQAAEIAAVALFLMYYLLLLFHIDAMYARLVPLLQAG